MSSQSDLDKRTLELQGVLDCVEALFPSLFVHGLHITSQDMSLFNKQYKILSGEIPSLSDKDQALGLKILHWFHHNYPHYHGKKP